MIKNGICCFTGHRTIEDEDLLRLPATLDSVLDSLISSGVKRFRTGGAVGFDTLCALKILERKKRDPLLSLELCLPCQEQTKSWEEREIFIYDYILDKADTVSYASEDYTQDCMFKRNRMLVDGADVCVAFLSDSEGGTAYTVSYAEEAGVEVINLYDKLSS